MIDDSFRDIDCYVILFDRLGILPPRYGTKGARTMEHTNSFENTSRIEPLLAFQAVPHNSSSSSVTSLCFLGGYETESKQSRPDCEHSAFYPNTNNKQDAADDSLEKVVDDDDDDDDDEFESHFSRPSRDASTATQRISSSFSSSAVTMIRDRLALNGVKLATCDFDGNALIWDLTCSTVVGRIVDTTRGPGLSLRRIDEQQKQQPSRFLYHTRDPRGTVSLHDLEKLQTVTSFSTQSHTFCAAVPCKGDENLVALPSMDGSEVVIRDWRVSPSSTPVRCFSGGAGDDRNHNHGMLTSLAMWKGNQANVVLCGMEDGSLFFHDWSRIGNHGLEVSQMSPASSQISLGIDPILTLDVSPSPERDSSAPSFVCLAGMAGDAEEVGRLDESDRGRIAVVKAKVDENPHLWRSRIRKRLGTAVGKPGVSVCRFRPDGRVFVAGGWDRRVRVFHRDGRALAVLRGHGDGIQSVDWFSDSTTGLLASGSSDGRVCVWRAFGVN